MDHCDECGFTYADHGPSAAREIQDLVARFEALLSGGSGRGLRLAAQPSPDVWSPVEYGCHVRDVLLAQRERLLLALVEEEPAFAPMYRDQRAGIARYRDESPGHVGAEIVFAADLLARVFRGLTDAQWDRTCVYNYPEPSRRTILWLGRHTLHEVTHHLLDLERGVPTDDA